MKLKCNDVSRIKKKNIGRGGGIGRGGKAAVNVCGVRKSKRSSPNDSCKSSVDERKSLREEKVCRAMRLRRI